MERKEDSQKYSSWYKEISLLTQKITKGGNSAIIRIPSSVVLKHELKPGSKVHIILFISVSNRPEDIGYATREVSLPLQKVIKNGNSFAILIPASIMKAHNLEIGNIVHPILHIRMKKYLTEISDKRIWVNMLKTDFIRFKSVLEAEKQMLKDTQ